MNDSTNGPNAETARDLRDEYAELAALCATLTPEQWRAPSVFYGWSPWDEIAHLCFFDETSMLALNDPEAFVRDAAALNAQFAQGREISSLAREKYGQLDGPAMLALWQPISMQLADALAVLDPKARLPWYGPMMSARSFATARLMETWAHGQDIWDLMRRRRPASARLRHIAHIGATTFGWTFVNRQLPVPEPAPFIELDAPDGQTWRWGDPASAESVRGDALDFCLVVTQRRHLADTVLRCTPGSATQWLSIAQCFAGPPADPPAPGVRAVVYDAA
ncbi:TIGR03084 family metal-binding protein [Variovorax paradoxus]|uniref:TIGR03084 family metal-binding protein n=1 Tax=Variovorax paradoxus TaxID=34073 RepID=UPI001933470C|nr:TIGR03084 family protein [Variovorax paradoxus]